MCRGLPDGIDFEDIKCHWEWLDPDIYRDQERPVVKVVSIAEEVPGMKGGKTELEVETML